MDKSFPKAEQLLLHLPFCPPLTDAMNSRPVLPPRAPRGSDLTVTQSLLRAAVGCCLLARVSYGPLAKLPIRLVQNLCAVDGVAVDVVQEPPEGRADVLVRERARRELL